MTFPEQVGQLRRTLSRALARHVAETSARPMQEMRALWVVSSGEVRTQAQLAVRLLIDAPAASRLVARLQAEGMLQRHAGDDRRSVRLGVTPAGRADAKVMRDAVRWLDREVARHAGKAERETALRVLLKVQRGLEG